MDALMWTLTVICILAAAAAVAAAIIASRKARDAYDSAGHAGDYAAKVEDAEQRVTRAANRLA
jgi:hypothetical protein